MSQSNPAKYISTLNTVSIGLLFFELIPLTNFPKVAPISKTTLTYYVLQLLTNYGK